MAGMINRTKYIFTLGIISFFAYFPIAGAQENSARGVSISPVKYEFTADPGEVFTEKMKVYNPTDGRFSVTMEVDDFRPVGEEGQVAVGDAGSERYSMKKWISAEPQKFVLEPRQEQFVTFTIKVPQNADPGGKYGSVLAVMNPDVSPGQTGSLISQKVGSLVLLSVSGKVEEKLNVKEIAVPGFSEYGPLDFGIRFENKGTVHLRPRGFLTIENMLGKKSADLEIPEQNVIPGAVRRVDAKWEKKWLFGKYSARIVGDYGQARLAIDSPVVFFWVLPWKILLAGLAVLALLGFILFRSRRRLWAALRIIIRGDK